MYEIYEKMRPFTDEEINKLLEKLEKNERVVKFFKKKREVAFAILKDVNVTYWIRYGKIQDEMEELKGAVWRFF